MKLTKKQLDKIKKLFSRGKTIKEISKKLGINESMARYHLDENTRKKTIKRMKERYKNLPEKEKKELSEKTRGYRVGYYYNRYHTNPKYREMIKKKNRENKRKRREKAMKEGLCVVCLGERDGKFKLCSDCRKKRREKSIQVKGGKSKK